MVIKYRKCCIANIKKNEKKSTKILIGKKKNLLQRFVAGKLVFRLLSKDFHVVLCTIGEII